MAAGTVQQRRAWEEQEYARREWHYAKCEGTARRHKRALAELEANRRLIADEVKVKHSSAADVRATLEKRAKLQRQLERELRALPPGDERRAAIRACLNAGIAQRELALLLDVSKQRVSQLVREAESIPF